MEDLEVVVRGLVSAQKEHIESLHREIETYRDMLSTCNDLVLRSEARIDKTNEAVLSLAQSSVRLESTLSQISDEYCAHIDKLVECRDSILEQNKTLSRQLDSTQREVDRLREEHREQASELIGLIRDMARSGSSGVKIENRLRGGEE